MGERVRAPERWPLWLAFGLLALATVVGVVAAGELGYSRERVTWTLGLTAVTAGWLVLWGFAVPVTPRRGVTAFVGRTGLAGVLTWLNPFYALFAFVGYIDAFDVFRRRWATYAGVAVTAMIMAGSQSGGLPPRSGGQWAVFGALFVVNAGLASAFTRMHERMTVTSERRADTITELEQLNARLRDALAENDSLHRTVAAQARAAGVQEERQRLAREIHDTLAQSLAGIAAQLAAAGEGQDERGRQVRVDRAAALARDALAEARRSVQGLGPGPLSTASLADALREVVCAWGLDHPVKADLVVTGEARALHPEVEAALVRITQESLTNVAKHAAASRVGVTLTYLEDEVILDVRDDGVGFEAGRAPEAGSFGLQVMRERSRRLAGALDVESGPGAGTAVSARLPALGGGAA